METQITQLIKVIVCIASVVVAFSPNVLHAAVALLVAFMGVAGMYVIAGADFLAGAQVIVYIGGILVVIMFAIMLSHRIYNIPFGVQLRRASLAALVGGALIAVVWTVNEQFPWKSFIKTELPERTSSVVSMGNALLKEYVLPFEAISLLLLVALVGAMIMSRPSERDVSAEGTGKTKGNG